MKDPKEAPPPPPPEPEWSDIPSKINHLSEDNFDSFMKDHKSVLVMFYAPCEYSVSVLRSRFDVYLSLHFVYPCLSWTTWCVHNRGRLISFRPLFSSVLLLLISLGQQGLIVSFVNNRAQFRLT